MNGIEGAKQIRPVFPAIPIILFSGQAAATDMIEVAQLEGHGFEVLAKPIRPESLIRVVQRLLSNRNISPFTDLQSTE